MNWKYKKKPDVLMRITRIICLFIIFFGCKSNITANDSIVSEKVKQWLTFNEGSEKAHIVLISGDEEYRSEEALPQLAKILAHHHGFKCTVLFAQDPEKPGIVNPNYVHNIPGLEQLKSADLMIIFTRFRALPDEQMQHIDDYLRAGKPVIGMRTSTHAFRFNNIEFNSQFLHYGNFYDKNDDWKDGFGRLVLGEKWIAHHGRHGHQGTRALFAKDVASHPILNGIGEGDIWGPTDVYSVRLPLQGDAHALLLGQVVDRDGEYNEDDPLLGMRPTDSKLPDPINKAKANEKEIMIDQNSPMMPVAWTKSYQIPNGKNGHVFTTTMGASTDLLSEGMRRLLVNASYWCLNLKVPEKAAVNIVDTYNPTKFKFYENSYWEDKNLTIESLN